MVRLTAIILVLSAIACERPAPGTRGKADSVPTQRAMEFPEPASKPDNPVASRVLPSPDSLPIADTVVRPAGVARESLKSVTGRLDLLPAMNRVLKDSIPEFVTWSMEHYDSDVQGWVGQLQNVPWAVFADFNRDSMPDVVMDGTDGRRSLRVALVSVNSSYRILVLDSMPLVDQLLHNSIEFLAYQAAGPIDTLACDSQNSDCHDEPFRLSADGFQVVWFEKASSLWYWTGEKFEGALTSD